MEKTRNKPKNSLGATFQGLPRVAGWHTYIFAFKSKFWYFFEGLGKETFGILNFFFVFSRSTGVCYGSLVLFVVTKPTFTPTTFT
jgi:hypothetical protein